MRAPARSNGIAHPIRWLRGYLSDADCAHERRRSAQHLATLSDQLLSDIGLSRADAEMLARNPDVMPDCLRRC